jgi:hypothetical protein
MHSTSVADKFTEFLYTKLSTPTLCLMVIGSSKRRFPSNQLIVFCYAESIVYSSIPEMGKTMVGDLIIVYLMVVVKMGSGTRDLTYF